MTGSVQVRLPALVATMFPDAPRRLAVQASTVAEMMDRLDAEWPGLKDCFCDSRPAIRRHINVFVAGRRVGLDAKLPPGADVYVLTAISGG